MNNAKMWLVVKPTVGIPLFLSAVAIGSFAVHVSVLTNTSWVGDFLQGKPLGSGDRAEAVLPQSAQPSLARWTAEGQEVLIQLPDGTTARAVLKEPASRELLAQNAPGRSDEH